MIGVNYICIMVMGLAAIVEAHFDVPRAQVFAILIVAYAIIFTGRCK